jgi:hypothetical protein
MKTLENKTNRAVQVIDGAGIIPNGIYLTTKEEVEKMVLNHLEIIQMGRYTLVKNKTKKRIIPNGNYLATKEEVEKMVLRRIKYSEE